MANLPLSPNRNGGLVSCGCGFGASSRFASQGANCGFCENGIRTLTASGSALAASIVPNWIVSTSRDFAS